MQSELDVKHQEQLNPSVNCQRLSLMFCKNLPVYKRWLFASIAALFVGAIPFAGEILTLVGIIVLLTIYVARRILPCSRSHGKEQAPAPSQASVEKRSQDTEQPKTSASDHQRDDEEATDGVTMDPREKLEEKSEHMDTQCSRLHFLDNVKIFLTATAVTHHCACAFGGCGSKSWFLMVGMYDNAFSMFAKALTSVDQAYFMPLFFFVSAYFVPPSYEAKGDRFLTVRARRLWIPAMLVTFILIPMCFLVGGIVAGVVPLVVIPHPGQSWFLYWLLLLNWCYVTIRSSTVTSLPLSQRCKQLPSTLHRLFAGFLICGWGMLLVVGILVANGSFAGMPLSTGSVTCDCFMFYIGIIARENKWLDRSLRQQLDIAIWKLRLLVLLEGAAIIYLSPKADTTPRGIGFAVALFSVAGPFCLDMSVIVLDFFQVYLNNSNRLTRFLADSAYGVYLLHPLIIVLLTSAFILIHNEFISTTEEQHFSFQGFPPYSVSQTTGGATTLAAGWALVVVASHLLVWPAAWGMKQLFPSIL